MCPVLNDDTLESHKLPLGKYQYNAAKIEDLGASGYTLVVVISDVSSSVTPFKTELEDCLKQVVEGCSKSPEADNLLMMHLQFASNVMETHGFKLLDTCDLSDYDGSLRIGGSTSLYDAWMFGLSALSDYAKKLDSNEFEVNALVVCITDGDDNTSSFSGDDVKNMIASINRQESLDSLMTILIGLNHHPDQNERDYFSNRLKTFKDAVGITQFAEVKDTTGKTFAKLAQFISKSVSSQSKSLGTGGASKPLTI